VSGEIGATAVKRQLAPSAAKSGDASIGVLQTGKPFDSAHGGHPRFRRFRRKIMESKHGSGCVIGVRNAAG